MDTNGGNYASKRKRKQVRGNTNADDSFLFSRSDITKTKRMHEHKKQENNKIQTKTTTRKPNSSFNQPQTCGLDHRKEKCTTISWRYHEPCSVSEASDSELLAISLKGQMLCMQNLYDICTA